jgi:hypothetical protein
MLDTTFFMLSNKAGNTIWSEAFWSFYAQNIATGHSRWFAGKAGKNNSASGLDAGTALPTKSHSLWES